MTLVDAGPLVAILSQDDRHHARCAEVLRRLREPLLTAWPILTEAMYLLRISWSYQDRLWSMLDRGGLRILPLDDDDIPRMRELMEKYRDLPMDLADAALVRLAERERIREVFTLVQRDFTVYRAAGIGRFSILP